MIWLVAISLWLSAAAARAQTRRLAPTAGRPINQTRRLFSRSGGHCPKWQRAARQTSQAAAAAAQQELTAQRRRLLLSRPRRDVTQAFWGSRLRCGALD